MKGDVYSGGVQRTRDAETGAEVTRLTDNLSNTHHPYFTQNIIGAGNDFIIVTSDVSGSRQIHTLSLADGKMVQATQEENGSAHGACLGAKNNIVYYFSGRVLKGVRLDNLQTEELFEIPEGFSTSVLSCTNDGRYLAFSYSEKLNLSTQTGVLYSSSRENQFRRPHSVVMRFDTVEKKAYAVWGETEWISHVNISPIDPDIILFCHEGNWHLVQRMWIARVATDEIYPIVKQRYNYERAGHEFFLSNGRIGAQYSIRQNLQTNLLNDMLFGDVFVDPDGSNQEIFFYPYGRGGHIQMNYAMTMGATDGAHIRKEMTDSRRYMGLTKYEGNRVDIRMICRHGSSNKTQASHPHPVFTRDDSHVIYSSDAGGKLNVYLVEANWEKAIKATL